MSRVLTWRYWITIIGLVGLVSCSPKTFSLSSLSTDLSVAYDDWDDWTDVPRTIALPWAKREIRTAVHFFDTTDTLVGWKQDYVNEYAQILIESTNRHFRTNTQMNLPAGNMTAVLDANIKLKLSMDDIYIHHTGKDAFFIKKGPKANRYDRRMISAYAKDEDFTLNVFIMPFDPAEVASGAQQIESTGIALGSTIKLAGLHEQHKGAWNYASLLAHEVGHVLGLRHSWGGNDGCDDTPDNDNCWNTSKTPPCDGITSNNLMDYNATQAAITPCQIATMHINMANPVSRGSRITLPLDCNTQRDITWTITDTQKWDKAVAVPGDIEIQEGGRLYFGSFVSLASDATITIKKGGTLLIDRALIAPRCEEDRIQFIVHKGGKVYSRDRTTILSGNPLN